MEPQKTVARQPNTIMMRDTDERNKPLLPLLLLAGISPLLYFEPLHNPSHLPRYALFSIVAAMALVYWAFRAGRAALPVTWHPVQLLVAGLLLLASISSLWNADHSNYLIEIVPFWGLVILFLLATQISSQRSILLLAVVSTAAGSVAALIGLLQNWGINPLGFRDGFTMGSTFLFKNHAALYFDLILPVALCLILLFRDRPRQWLAAVAFALLLAFILESKTRGSWVGLAVAGAVLLGALLKGVCGRELAGRVRDGRWPLLAAVITAVAISLVPGKIDEMLAGRITLDGGKLDDSSAHRLYAYRNSLELIMENPLLGSGYGSFRKAFRPYTNHPIVIERSDEHNNFARLHNDPLQAFVELGIVGGILSLVIFGYVLYMAWVLIKSPSSSARTRILILGLSLALIASATHSLFDFPLHKPSSALQFWLWMGLISGLYMKQHDTRTMVPGRNRLSIGAGLGILYLSITLLFYSSYVKGNWLLRDAILSFEQRDCAGATRMIDASVASFGLYFVEHAMRTQIHTTCEDDMERLFQVLSEEIAWDDTNTLALLTRGNLLLQVGLFEQAEQDFRRVVEILPHRPLGKMGLARALAAQGDLDDAQRYLAKIAAQHGASADITRLLEAIGDRRNSGQR